MSLEIETWRKYVSGLKVFLRYTYSLHIRITAECHYNKIVITITEKSCIKVYFTCMHLNFKQATLMNMHQT